MVLAQLSLQYFHFIVSSDSLNSIHQPLFSFESIIVILDVCLRKSLALFGKFFTSPELHFTDLPVVLLFYTAGSALHGPLVWKWENVMVVQIQKPHCENSGCSHSIHQDTLVFWHTVLEGRHQCSHWCVVVILSLFSSVLTFP